MAIVQTKKNSDLEKRLTLLRQQIYGKQEFKTQGKTTNYQLPASLSQQTTNSMIDTAYLYKDLLKIGIFAIVAFGIQFFLFYLLPDNSFNINLF